MASTPTTTTNIIFFSDVFVFFCLAPEWSWIFVEIIWGSPTTPRILRVKHEQVAPFHHLTAGMGSLCSCCCDDFDLEETVVEKAQPQAKTFRKLISKGFLFLPYGTMESRNLDIESWYQSEIFWKKKYHDDPVLNGMICFPQKFLLSPPKIAETPLPGPTRWKWGLFWDYLTTIVPFFWAKNWGRYVLGGVA